MEDAKRRVVLFGIQETPHLLASIRGQVERWIERKSKILSLPKEDFEYRVRIEREEDSRLFSCRIAVRIGQSEWIGFETGRTFQTALTLALRTMQGTVLPFPRIPVHGSRPPSPYVA